jgi:hypothetical protein
MSKREKLKQKFLAKSKDFTYDELKTLLAGFGYRELKSAGSRIAFIMIPHNTSSGCTSRIQRMF